MDFTNPFEDLRRIYRISNDEDKKKPPNRNLFMTCEWETNDTKYTRDPWIDWHTSPMMMMATNWCTEDILKDIGWGVFFSVLPIMIMPASCALPYIQWSANRLSWLIMVFESYQMWGLNTLNNDNVSRFVGGKWNPVMFIFGLEIDESTISNEEHQLLSVCSWQATNNRIHRVRFFFGI